MKQKNRKKENGRPKQTYKRFPFEETPLGFMLKYEVPVVFDVIMYLSEEQGFIEPPYLLIKTVCEGSSDPSLKKPKFYRYLEAYFKDGVCCKRGKKMTPKRRAYYESIRKKKLNKFIIDNEAFIKSQKVSVLK